ncbi:MAG: hypothetical protein NTX53_19120 [candidate division WOR-3 bacterium]|nr:hypothetical protein [candidate division WOR-3 bacterium]
MKFEPMNPDPPVTRILMELSTDYADSGSEFHPQITQIAHVEGPEFHPQITQITQIARTEDPEIYPQITQITQITQIGGQELHPQTRKTTEKKGAFIHRFHSAASMAATKSNGTTDERR